MQGWPALPRAHAAGTGLQCSDACRAAMAHSALFLWASTVHCLQMRTFTYGDFSVVLKEGALGDGTGAKVHFGMQLRCAQSSAGTPHQVPLACIPGP